MSIKKKAIHLDDASCLKASTSSLRVAIIQPKGNLKMTENIGPYYAKEQIEKACNRSEEFFRIVREYNSELAIAPEFFLPYQIAEKIVNDTSMLRKDTLFILPMETQKFHDFNILINKFHDNCEWNDTVSEFDLVQDIDDKYVNAVLILYIQPDNKKYICVQLKINPSSGEMVHMLCGKEVFAIEGENGVLSVAICSDVNSPLEKVWGEIAGRKAFSYTVHCQFNPKPDFENYYTGFWSNLLNDAGGDERLIFSINWCKGSGLLFNDKNITINRQSNRFIRGRVMQKGYMYPQRSQGGLHLQQKTESENSRKKWENWYCIAKTDNIRIIDFVRPRQNRAPAQSDFSKGITSALFFELDTSGKYIEKLPQNLSIEYLKKLGSEVPGTPIESFLEKLSLCELETFNSSCNLKYPDTWLEEDIDARVPTAFLLCNDPMANACDDNNNCPQIGKTCYKRRAEWEKETTNVAICLDALNRLKRQEEHKDVEIYVTGPYPVNLRNQTSGTSYWIFHGNGWPIEKVYKLINIILDKSNTRKNVKQLELFATGVINKEISVHNILISPSEDIWKVNIGVEQDIFETNHLPCLHIL